MLSLYPYNGGSKGARALATALGIKIIKRVGSRYRPRRYKTLINWGCNILPERMFTCRIINKPHSVALARCKAATFQVLEGEVRIPEYTTSLPVALEWLRTGDVCSRATTTGHEGIGLCIHPRGSNDLPRVPLYTKYIKKASEWRVHVIGDTTYIQRKLRKRGTQGDTKIRNTANGYVFTSKLEGREVPGDIASQAQRAVRALGLDFAAVDVVWNDHYQQATVLEVNTAPGIEGNTVAWYALTLRNFINGFQ